MTSPYFHLIVLLFFYSCKHHSPSIARDTDTQDTLLISKMRRKNANLLSFVHRELLETNIIRISSLLYQKHKSKDHCVSRYLRSVPS